MIQILKVQKTKKETFLIGEVGVIKDKIRIKEPFELVVTEEGLMANPYDLKYIDKLIPYIDYFQDEIEYNVQAPEGLTEFYNNALEKFKEENKIDKTDK